MIDLHSHLVPGVDDGATSLDESRGALATMQGQGIRGLITTPHLNGSLTERPAALEDFFARTDAAWNELRKLAAAEFPELVVARGAEVMLDTPTPDLSDLRTRLAGTRFVLVEFPFMKVPPNASQALFDLKMRGWNPVVAHPERYGNLHAALDAPEEWRRTGAHLQVNCGSLLGRYGERAQKTAWTLLEHGWVDYLASDYHARGRCAIADARAELLRRGGDEQSRLLMEVNPARLLQDEAPEVVPPLARRPSLWKRLFTR